MKKKVLIVDDSRLVQQLLTQIIDGDERLQVVGTASDPYEAREKIKQLNPDVLTLDVEMPRMDGIQFLKNLMRLRPMPVIMISTLTQKGAPATLEALAIGALDYVPKPEAAALHQLNDYAEELREKLVMAAQANLRAREQPVLRKVPVGDGQVYDMSRLIAIGASTGGTEAIQQVLTQMPGNIPPIVITQHIPPRFSGLFAERVNRLCEIAVVEATNGMKIAPGTAYIAPGDFHMTVSRKGMDLYCQLDQSERVNRHRPSVEVMFDSVRNVVGPKAIGVLLTGMGADGSEALLRMRQAGCHTICQDEASSVVWGMPGVAVRLGAAEKVLPLGQVAQASLNWCIRR